MSSLICIVGRSRATKRNGMGEGRDLMGGGSQESSDEGKIMGGRVMLERSGKAFWRKWYLIQGLKDREDSNGVQVEGTV